MVWTSVQIAVRIAMPMGERQSIAQKGVRAIDARNSQLENGSNAAKTSVRAPGLSAFCVILWGWLSQFLTQQVRTMSFSEKAHTVSNRNRSQIARFGALRLQRCTSLCADDVTARV